MTIAALVLHGYSNGSFLGTIGEVVTRGYSISSVTPPTVPGLEWTAPTMLMHYTVDDDLAHYTVDDDLMHYTANDD